MRVLNAAFKQQFGSQHAAKPLGASQIHGTTAATAVTPIPCHCRMAALIRSADGFTVRLCRAWTSGASAKLLRYEMRSELGGWTRSAASAHVRRHGPVSRCPSNRQPVSRAGGVEFARGGFASEIVSKRPRSAGAPPRLSTGRSWSNRASQNSSLAATPMCCTSTAFRQPAPASFYGEHRPAARPRVSLSTTVRPGSSRAAVLRRPRANRPSRD